MTRDSISDILEETVKEQLSELLIGLEDKNPTLAAAVQAVIDGDEPPNFQTGTPDDQ